MKPKLKAPFPYFGGKSSVASLVWDRIGDCDNVIEPFCGSAAFLLARPHKPRVETLNDENAYVCNFWRATKFAPEEVVEWCDWPVDEMSLHSEHRWLVLSDHAVAFRQRLKDDPEYFDAKIAGRWVHGACCWIGGEWCRYTDSNAAEWNQTPKEASGWTGVHGNAANQARRPVIANPGSDAGKGVHGNPPEQHLPQKMPSGVRGEAYTPNCPRAAPSWPMPTTSAAACAGRRRRRGRL